MELYDNIGEAYDIVYGDEVAGKVNFVSKLLSKYKAKCILELGCGTGLFTIPLSISKQEFYIEGLEISQEMIRVCKQKAPTLDITLGDASDYSLNKKFDAVLALSSLLVILKDYEEVYKCLQCTAKHLKQKGLFLIELPNHEVEIKYNHNTQQLFYSKQLSEIVVIQSLKEEGYWREYWSIFKRKPEGLYHKKIICQEFLYDPSFLENEIENLGFNIIERYGDLSGKKYDPKTSLRNVLVCQKM